MRTNLFAILVAIVVSSNTLAATTDAFKENGDGTITDTKTGLLWQKSDSGWGLTWSRAMDYCKGLSLAGHSDWRLPNRDELVALFVNAGSEKDFFAIFPKREGGNDLYWSSTPAPGTSVSNAGNAWDAFPGSRKAFVNDKQLLAHHARCVRSKK
jgi:hypothetical protein